jgi:hypothetical protein
MKFIEHTLLNMILNNFNSNIARSFLNFFILLIILNPFLLVDPELLIFFSISLIILLFINNLSDVLSIFFRVKVIQYYYYYIRFYNLQLLFLFELSKYLKFYLYLFNLPFYVKWYMFYLNSLNEIFSINFQIWNNLFNLNILTVLHQLKTVFYHFYINFFFLLGREVRLRFLNIKLANYRLLSNYILKHFKFNKSANKTRNSFLIRRDLPNLLKFLKLKNEII